MDKKKKVILTISVFIAVVLISSFIISQKSKQDKISTTYAKVNEGNNAIDTSTLAVASSSPSTCTASASTLAVAEGATKTETSGSVTSNIKNGKPVTKEQNTPDTAINSNQRKIETPSPSANIPENKSVNTEKAVTFTGYIIDQDCFVSYSDPALETKGCLDMPECANSGYGIATKEDGKYQFYVFDGKISSLKGGDRIQDATGGQQKAWDFIEGSIVDKTIPVSVSGVLTGNSITLGGQTYKEIRVTSISEN